MKKITALAIATLFALFSFVSCAKKPAAPKAGSAKAEDMLTLIPKEASGVFVINFHRAITTEVANKAIRQSKDYKKYQEFIQETGVDPQKDIYFIAAAPMGRIGQAKQEAVLIVNLKYKKDVLLAKIKKEDVVLKEAEYNGVTIYSAEDPEAGRPKHGAFLDDSNIVFGNEKGVKAVIDVYQKKAQNILKNEELSALIKESNKEAIIWSAIFFPPEATKELTAQNPFLKNLEGIKSSMIYFDYKNKNIVAEIKAMSSDESKNRQLADLLNGLKAAGGMTAAKDQNVAELLNGIEISSGADHVKIYISIPEELLDKLGKAKKKEGEEKSS